MSMVEPRRRTIERCALLALCLVTITASPVLAADKVFGTESPITRFVDFISGPFAYLIVIVALVATVGALALGGEFSGFSRRIPVVVLAGGVVIMAGTVISNLFGQDRTFEIPPHWQVEPWAGENPPPPSSTPLQRLGTDRPETAP